MSRNLDRADRMLRLIAYLRRHPGAHVADVAKHAGVSIDALHALLAQITLCGRQPFGPGDLVDVFVEDDRVHLEVDQALGRPTRLLREEALALTIALDALSVDPALPLAEAARTAREKLRAYVRGEDADEVATLAPRIAVEGEDASTFDRLARLRCAFEERREVDLVYYAHSRDDMAPRRLRTYALVQNLGAWYAVGWDRGRHAIRIFKVDRIADIRITDDRYEIPASFKAERYRRDELFIGARPNTARVRVRAPLAAWIDESKSRIEPDPGEGGAIIASLQYVQDEGILPMLAAIGEAIEVLDPPELKEKLAARCRRTLALYQEEA
jgi:predicted DNA-binding transcriptional regulator YafY